MVIIETPLFSRLINEMMTEDEYRVLQEALVGRPETGVIIKGGGGLRKLRWATEGRGKSGGARIIYYWVTQEEQLYMLFAFPKNTQSDLTAEQLKKLRQIVERWPL